MTHIATQEVLDGKTADWMKKVSDEQYQAPNTNQIGASIHVQNESLFRSQCNITPRF
jgi:hypothetical protein